MMAIPLPLTKKQLAEIVQSYAAVFSDWTVVGGDRLVRVHGPILQQIGFETLRSGAYRPAGGLRALPLTTVRMLHQFLDVKHRQTLLREHPAKWKGVVTAMEQQFCPSIREPLDLVVIEGLCKQAARESSNDLCMLALLHAYLGKKEDAISCCERIKHAGLPTLAPLQDWEQRHRDFGSQLRTAIEEGNERHFLDAATNLGMSELLGRAEGNQQHG
jgi:hypothetical protein